MKRALVVCSVVLLSGVAVAGVFGGGGGGGAGAVVDVLAELVGKNVNANSYTATNTSGPGFMATSDRTDAFRLGTHPRATIGPCYPGSPDVCVGPNDFGYTSKFTVWGDIVSQGIQVRDNIDILGNASILNNNGPVRLNDADGFVLNGGTAQKGHNVDTFTLDLAPIPNNSCLTVLVAWPLAQLHDRVKLTVDFDLPDDVIVTPERVPEAGQVRLKACNISNEASQNPDSGPFIIELDR